MNRNISKKKIKLVAINMEVVRQYLNKKNQNYNIKLATDND